MELNGHIVVPDGLGTLLVKKATYSPVGARTTSGSVLHTGQTTSCGVKGTRRGSGLVACRTTEFDILLTR